MNFGGESLLRRRDARAQGLTDFDIRRAVDRGEIVPVWRGVYARGDTLKGLDAEERHSLTVRAALLDATTGSAASHQSAAALHRLGLFAPDFGKVHVSIDRTTGGHVDARRHVHAAGLQPADVVAIAGTPVTSPARTVADLARTSTFEQAVCVGDSAVNRKLATVASVSDALTRTATSFNKKSAEQVIDFLDGRSESVGESRSRVYFRHWGVPEPELQVTLLNENGKVVARPDFLWEEAGLIGEFDGMVKYTKHGRAGESPGDVVAREKRREDLLRSYGWMVVRWTWKELSSRAVADRLLREIATRRPTPGTIRMLST